MNKIGIKLDIARFAKHVNFTYWVICHACESRHPELLILLDSRFRGNDDLYDKIAQFRYDIFILEVMEMTILKKLKDYFEKNRVSYEVGYHARVYTAQEVAASQHVS